MRHSPSVIKSVAVAAICAISLGSGIGQAVANTTPSNEPVSARQPATPPISQADVDALIAKLDSVPANSSPEKAAGILFPNDPAARAQWVKYSQNVEQAAATPSTPGQPTTRAVPAALAPFLVVISRCIVGALGGAGVNEIITLVHKGQQATAEARVYALVGGCITTVVPPFLRPLANKAKQSIVTAVLWLVIKWGPK